MCKAIAQIYSKDLRVAQRVQRLCFSVKLCVFFVALCATAFPCVQKFLKTKCLIYITICKAIAQIYSKDLRVAQRVQRLCFSVKLCVFFVALCATAFPCVQKFLKTKCLIYITICKAIAQSYSKDLRVAQRVQRLCFSVKLCVFFVALCATAFPCVQKFLKTKCLIYITICKAIAQSYSKDLRVAQRVQRLCFSVKLCVFFVALCAIAIQDDQRAGICRFQALQIYIHSKYPCNPIQGKALLNPDPI
jgi:hypothetical protein